MNFSKRQRIALAIAVFILFSCLSSYRTIERNTRNYRDHPIASLLGAATPNIFVGLGLYWLLGIQRKKSKFNPAFFKAKSIDNRKRSDWAFEQAANELESGLIEKPIWARALSECNGDEAASKARYISLKVERLISERVLEDQKLINAKPESAESLTARMSFKRTLVYFAAVIVSAIAYLAYQYFENRQTSQSKYYGLTFGMTMEEVILAKGLPTSIVSLETDPNNPFMHRVIPIEDVPRKQNGKHIEDYLEWRYGVDNASRSIRAVFSPTTKSLYQIVCYIDSTRDVYDECRILGVSSGMSEESVLDKLGKPDNETNYESTKIIEYTDVGLKVYLRRNIVYMLTLEAPKGKSIKGDS
jgi:hypothetical protein